jgi:hypothetical protein
MKFSVVLYTFLFVTTSFCAIQEVSIHSKLQSSLSRGPEWNLAKGSSLSRGPEWNLATTGSLDK